MAIDNPFIVQYGSRALGGTSDIYLLDGPSALDKSFDVFSFTFDVMVVADSYANLKTHSDNLETDMRKRDQTLIINLDGSVWTYTFGTDILNSRASLSKTGNPETDRGFSRSYTCTVEGTLPADDQDGLSELNVSTDLSASRQKLVTMTGSYTSLAGTNAVAQYLADFDAEAATILTAIDATATFELITENYSQDRNRHTCPFTRVYRELLFDQSVAGTDVAGIRDHTVEFIDVTSHSGNSLPIFTLRSVAATYEAAVDDTTTDLRALYTDTVRPHLLALFQANFSPSTFGIEDSSVSYDETGRRIAVAMTFTYQSNLGGGVVSVSQSVAFRENRTIDYTPLHQQDELAYEADAGWATVLRVASRTVQVVGTESPKRRLGENPDNGPAGSIVGIEGGKDVTRSGWNIISNDSEVTRQYIGDPSEEILLTSILTETVVEQFNKKPGARR